MKLISDFHFSTGALFIDLRDAKRSVVVDVEDGSVTLQEGSEADRINHVCIPGPKVIAFQVDTDKGTPVVRCLFHAKDGIQSYILGVTTDDASAHAWVNRVNTIYADRKTLADRIAEFRQGKWRAYPVVHDIFHDHRATVLPGDYIYSGCEPTQQPPSTYVEPWEEFYISRTETYLREFTGLRAKITRSIGNRVPHHYTWLSTRVKYDQSQYERRITHPLELVFDRVERHDKLAIIPKGLATTFAVLFSRDNDVAGRMHPREVAAPFLTWIGRVAATADSDDRLLICTPLDHSVDFSIRDAMYRGYINPTQKFSAGDTMALAEWLVSNLRRGVVACDIGEAIQIRRQMGARHGPSLADALVQKTVQYESPIGVGLCCRADDTKWQEICTAALRDVYDVRSADIRDSLEKDRRLAQQIGIDTYVAA